MSGSGSSTWVDFPPHVLREYALIADGRRGALCGPEGDLVWLCAPRWDSPAVLSSLIGGEGVFAITPAEPYVWGGYYEPGSLIWRNRWTTTSTRMEVREALAFPGEEHRTVVLRCIDAVEDDVTVRLVLDLRAEFGRHEMTALHRDESGCWTARSGNLWARLTGVPQGRVEGVRLVADISVRSGRQHHVMLEISDRPLGRAPDPAQLWTATESAWKDGTPKLDDTVAGVDARQAYSVMRGLTTPGGGMVAAATLGLPERAEEGRNYDYRYVWLRDQVYAGESAAVHEPLPLFLDAVDLIAARLNEHGPHPAPAYRVDGTSLPHEKRLQLSGYPGGYDVVGNWVNGQFQLDALGESVHLFGTALRHGTLDRDGLDALDIAVDGIRQHWSEPDAGIWELDDAWWTQSRLSCVAGLRTAATHLPQASAGELDQLADAILAETTRRCRHPSGRWQRSADDVRVDASLVLPPVRGALPATDPRTVATLREVDDTLVENGYVYRYARPGEPLGASEGAFVLCGFMTALAHLHRGDQVTAMHYFERSRSACGPPGLLAEEYDVQQRQLRGNLPQAFVHALLLETAQRLSR